jgi:SPX domain protein involved in polyphosphate accumulation
MYDEMINSQIPSQDSQAELSSIQENINWIADDINRLARFSRINYTGFLKIVKKHDRHTEYVLRPMFMVRLNQCPFWNEDNDGLLIKLSQLFSKVRDGGMAMSFKPTSQMGNYMDEQTTDARRLVVKRFFVQTENVLELKTYVLRHLPVLVYRDNSKKQDNIDPPISSVYLDDAELDSYNSRVEAADGSQIIRLRWYGSAKGNSSIGFERRTLAEENRGELKDRFTIKDKYVAGFLKGDQTFVEKSVRKMKNSGRTPEDVEKYERLIKDVQQTILKKKMEPGKISFYIPNFFLLNTTVVQCYVPIIVERLFKFLVIKVSEWLWIQICVSSEKILSYLQMIIQSAVLEITGIDLMLTSTFPSTTSRTKTISIDTHSLHLKSSLSWLLMKRNLNGLLISKKVVS